MKKTSKYISVALFSATLLSITAPVVTETVDAATFVRYLKNLNKVQLAKMRLWKIS